jgi:hypothetical protein
MQMIMNALTSLQYAEIPAEEINEEPSSPTSIKFGAPPTPRIQPNTGTPLNQSEQTQTPSRS